MALATLAGGWLVKRFRLEPRGVMVLVLSCAIVWSLGNLILMGIGCPNVRWAGTIENNMLDVRTNCTAECSCTSARFSPVCGDMTTFFSPCHAGCTEQSADSKTYNSCACVESGWAQRDTCESHCDSHVSFIVILFFLVFYVNLRNTGHMMITIRCVDKDHKDIALGVAQVCTGLIGVIPGPVLYATAIDTACELFADNCGQQGHCLVYDNERFRFLYHGISAAIGVVPIAAYAVVLVKCRDMRFDENHANSLAAAAAAADADARRETVMSQYESSV
ncbi:PREDICTED: solute carrier organic anion transporter family member 4A1-like [Priapulus caudatus]|uniref:Solute carrier organic anion transporter family member 4A1-like n=1 Tax=Priapulus caudatus TaxID=37621 RepID=A0ABM1DX46_PRICU|nr:PREDICTED: solute carrier organic anion transporter family member 4A1-like [Priapulus caudatus]